MRKLTDHEMTNITGSVKSFKVTITETWKITLVTVESNSI